MTVENPGGKRGPTITARIPQHEMRGATTAVDRQILTPLQAKDYVHRLRTEMKGRRDFKESAQHWTGQFKVLREAYDREEIKPAEFDLLMGAIIAENEYYGEIDVLTETYNRRAFLQRAREVFANSATVGEPVAFAIIDLDRFKRINDVYGHTTGDAVLQQAAGFLRTFKREEDILGRWGGEEFVLLLPGTTQAEAAVMLERLTANMPGAVEESLDEMGFSIDQKVTMSTGISDTRVASDPDDLFKITDSALYAAKEIGRNRTAIPGGEIDGSPTYIDTSTGDVYKERIEIVDGAEVRHYDKITT